jgi:hypothetical protein
MPQRRPISDPPDLLALLASVALGDETTIDIMADWLEERGECRSTLVRSCQTDATQTRREEVMNLFRVKSCLTCELDMVEPTPACPECRGIGFSQAASDYAEGYARRRPLVGEVPIAEVVEDEDDAICEALLAEMNTDEATRY